MEKIDRLGWADGISIRCHGARIGVRVSHSCALDQLAQHLPPGWRATASPVVDTLYSLIVGNPDAGNGLVNGERLGLTRFNLLYAGAGRVARSMNLDEVFDALESSLDAVVAVEAKHRLFVRAGVVGWRGNAIVLPGLRQTGTSTLVAELVKAGATYYSDEYAVFDREGRVHPYAKPLSFRAKKSEAPKKVFVETLGGEAGKRPLPVGLVLLTEYTEGIQWRPTVLTPGQAMLALVQHTVMARAAPQFAMEVLQRVASGARTLEGRRGEVESMATIALQRMPRLEKQRPGPLKRERSGAERMSYAT